VVAFVLIFTFAGGMYAQHIRDVNAEAQHQIDARERVFDQLTASLKEQDERIRTWQGEARAQIAELKGLLAEQIKSEVDRKVSSQLAETKQVEDKKQLAGSDAPPDASAPAAISETPSATIVVEPEGSAREPAQAATGETPKYATSNDPNQETASPSPKKKSKARAKKQTPSTNTPEQ
jgi:hypothetical protein